MTICGIFLEPELEKEQAELKSWEEFSGEQLGWKMSKEEKEGMMDKMMGVDQEMEMPMMPQMMEMMLQCLRMMLHNLPKEKQIDFVAKMVVTLMEQGCVGMSEEEKDLVAKVVDKVKTYNGMETT